jgi:hypothetical protein
MVFDMAEGEVAFGVIVGRHFNGDIITHQNTIAVYAYFATPLRFGRQP